MKNRNRGSYIATTYRQFLGESKLLRKEEVETQDKEEIQDRELDDSEIDADVEREKEPSIKASKKDTINKDHQSSMDNIKESLLEFERILSQMP